MFKVVDIFERKPCFAEPNKIFLFTKPNSDRNVKSKKKKNRSHSRCELQQPGQLPYISMFYYVVTLLFPPASSPSSLVV